MGRKKWEKEASDIDDIERRREREKTKKSPNKGIHFIYVPRDPK